MTDDQLLAAMITAYEDEPGVRQYSAMAAALAVAKPLIAAEAREAALREAAVARPQGCICPGNASLVCENPFCPRKNPLKLAQ